MNLFSPKPPASPPLPLPSGFDEQRIFNFLKTVRPAGAPEREMQNYAAEDWRRFVYTWGLVHDLSGQILELGSNPYFTTTLLFEFTDLKVTCANYFGEHNVERTTDTIVYCDPRNGVPRERNIEFANFNIEQDRIPFADAHFDAVMFCEILEHMTNDPCSGLREIRRAVRDGGYLIVTTPNVARLENVARMIAGANLYDPYSGYGPYGRHNREYTRHELWLMLDWAGFEIEQAFTADVHEERSSNYYSVPLRLFSTVRMHDLGQYLFIRAKAVRPARERRPSWLYRSYPGTELE
jgi:SAM-dependent methyltransferase